MRRAGGFTLLEVMVALALLSVALVALSDLSAGAVRNNAYARALTTATLLARAKMAQVEQQFEDDGFKDADEVYTGTFEEEGHADIRWRVEAIKPGDVAPDQILASFLGAEGGSQELMEKLMSQMGGGAPGGASASAVGAAAGPLGGLIQGQLTAFGQRLQKSLREVRLTVSWKEGREVRDFTVSTHLVVLCPKAQSGRGDWPDACPGSGGAQPLVPPGGGAGGGGGNTDGGRR